MGIVKIARKIFHKTTFYFNRRCFDSFDDPIWIVGDGRSGTTWAADVFNWRGARRIMFEPFHPVRNTNMKPYPVMFYLRPNEVNEQFYNLADSIFSGQFTNDWVDKCNMKLMYRGLLIKDVFANLFLARVMKHFTDLKIVMIMRHPFAVALSKIDVQKTGDGDWFWLKEPKYLLSQEPLFKDYLAPFEDMIATTHDQFEKHIINWAIKYYIPLQQLKRNQVNLLFYEEMCISPPLQLYRLLEHLGLLECDDRNIAAFKKILNKPSTTSRLGSAINSGSDPIDTWRHRLSQSQIDRGMEILRIFELDDIYGNELMPDRVAAENHFQN